MQLHYAVICSTVILHLIRRGASVKGHHYFAEIHLLRGVLVPIYCENRRVTVVLLKIFQIFCTVKCVVAGNVSNKMLCNLRGEYNCFI